MSRDNANCDDCGDTISQEDWIEGHRRCAACRAERPASPDPAQTLAAVADVLKRYNDAEGDIGSTDALQDIALILDPIKLEENTNVNGTLVRNLHKIEGEEVLFGTIDALGVGFYAYFIRVEERDDEQVAVNDPYHRLDDLYALDPDAGVRPTIEVPGFEGEYVVHLVTAGR